MPEQQPSDKTQQLVAEQFLLAPRFAVTPPRYFPKTRMCLTHAWSRLARRLADRLFERGVDTTEHAHLVTHYHPERVWYQPSGWMYLRRTLRRRDVGPEDVFVDLGSGKGRVLLQAARSYQFARVIGVEISDQLNVTARANIERQRARLRAPIEIVTADAGEYEIPDDVTVVYLYYPFVGETFRKMLDHLVASLERNPRRLRVIYADPILEDKILSTGLFRSTRSIRIVDFGTPSRITVYETVRR